MVGGSWKYCIDFLEQKDDLYIFAVKWSEPTRRKPVPRATASVYFHLLKHSEVKITQKLYNNTLLFSGPMPVDFP